MGVETRTPRSQREQSKRTSLSSVSNLQKDRCVILPERSRPLWKWDTVCAVLLVLVAVLTPFEAGFLEGDLVSPIGVFNILTNAFFFADMVLQFFIAYPIETRYGPRWVQIKKMIALRYLRGWFLIDLMSTLPLDYLSPGTGLGLLRTIRLLRLLKLLRLARGIRVVRRYQAEFGVSYRKSFKKLGCSWLVLPSGPMYRECLDLEAQQVTISLEPACPETSAAVGHLVEANADLSDAKLKPDKYFPIELTFSPEDLFYTGLGMKFWMNQVMFFAVGGFYRLSLWLGWRVPAAVCLATVFCTAGWQTGWQMSKLAIGSVSTSAVLVDLLVNWVAFFLEKYYLGLYRGYSLFFASVTAVVVFAPFGGDRRFFGMVSVLSVRAIAVLSILMGNYFVLLQFPSETLQDMFWPFTAFIYKSVTSNMVHLIWNKLPGRRDCSALWVTSATFTVTVSAEGWYYGGLILTVFTGVGTQYQVVRRAANSIATHAVFVLLARFNVINTVGLLIYRGAARRFGWRVPEIHEVGARRDLFLRASHTAGVVAWAITFMCCAVYALITLVAYEQMRCQQAAPTCHYLFRPASYVVGICAGAAMMLTELLAAVGMRLLRKARGDDEPAGWTMRALVEVFRRLSQPGMCVQAFATTSSDPLDPSVNLRMDQVPGLFCLSARECAACLISNHILAIVVSTIGSGLVVGMQDELQS
ncbi:KCNH7 [Symbiodinium natans]|uniref:KCNH7 protein n=1 Tax=Symbiodinium natans TaxID=878477 RepID=A0A812NVV2_9DINO|nr:KCNH7 [Symbiodinium natans]